MSRLIELLDLQQIRENTWLGPAAGPTGKRAFGGHLAGQGLAAAGRSVTDMAPTNMAVLFLRGGDADASVEYSVAHEYDGRTSACRRVLAHQGGRLLTTTTVMFSAPLDGPEHGHLAPPATDPTALERSGPAGPAPSMPLDEIDIRIADAGSGEDFRREFWWRTTVPLPDDPLLHACVTAYVTDVYMIDPALAVHGYSMRGRTHRSGTTASSIWFHRPLRADDWSLLATSSPAAARGRGLVTGSLLDTGGTILATLVQEGLIANR